MLKFYEITDEEWRRIAPLYPELHARRESRGRPLADTRSVFNGLMWVMYTGSAWSAMPTNYPPHTTCHRRFKRWCAAGALSRVIDALSDSRASDLHLLVSARGRAVKSYLTAERARHDGNADALASFDAHFDQHAMPYLFSYDGVVRPERIFGSPAAGVDADPGGRSIKSDI